MKKLEKKKFMKNLKMMKNLKKTNNTVDVFKEEEKFERDLTSGGMGEDEGRRTNGKITQDIQE